MEPPQSPSAALKTPDEGDSSQTPPPPPYPPSSSTPIHECLPHSTTTTTTTSTCCNGGGPAEIPPPQPLSSSISPPPPNHRPTRDRPPSLPPNHSYQAIIDTPVPKSQKVSVISLPHEFLTPSKKINHPDDMARFIETDLLSNFIGFIVSLSESIRGKKLSEPCRESETLTYICSVLDTFASWVDEIPPIQQTNKHGNFAYRDWYDRLLANSEALILKFLPEDLKSSTEELVPYFTDSFGNSARLDYGTNHELNFTAWIYCLARMGVTKEEDYQAVVSRVYVKYYNVTRKLQTAYDLEPGSHMYGFSGLDDYHFLPFIFGSSQLIAHKYMKPKSIHIQDILDNFAKEYLYISCIALVKKKKKGVFADNWPLLDDISRVPNWTKVNDGLLKMYKAEMLESLQYMASSFQTGSLLQW